MRRKQAVSGFLPSEIDRILSNQYHRQRMTGTVDVAKSKPLLTKRHQFRLALCGHKAVETGAVCFVLMVEGQLAQATLSHLSIAAQTGILAVFPLVGLTITRYARLFANRWASALLIGVCAFFADALIHGSHYPGAYTEAALTAIGTMIVSVIVSYTPVGKYIDRLAESFHK
jgi:hypothetical protein